MTFGERSAVLRRIASLFEENAAEWTDLIIRETGAVRAKAAGEVAVAASKLELGGDNALVILDDADVDAPSACGAWAAFEFPGRYCITAARHIVMRPLHQRYVEAVARRAKGMTVGDPASGEVDLGPLISEAQLAKVDGIVRRSVEMGGARLGRGRHHDALFHRPTVLDGVTPEMPAFTEEIFGPIVPVTVVDGEAEALWLVDAYRNLGSAV